MAMFRRYHPETSLSIEQNTENVPNDDRYYILYDGEILGSYGSLKAATNKYEEVFVALGLKTKVADSRPTKEDIRQMILEQELITDEIFWSTRHLRAKKSGKLRNR